VRPGGSRGGRAHPAKNGDARAPVGAV